MDPVDLGRLELDAAEQLARYQSFLTLPRETIPRLTARDAGTLLRAAAARLGLEAAEIAGVAPTFLLLPREAPLVTLFLTWTSTPLGRPDVAEDAADRLALAASLAALETVVAAEILGPREAPRAALVVAPAANAGSQGLDGLLREHRDRLRSLAAFWIRIAPAAPARRRVYLGSRGHVVVGLRGGDGNPYRARDQVVAELSEQAYGPRPLDFELIRKLANDPGSVTFAQRQQGQDAPAAKISAEEGIRRALFEPRGDVVAQRASVPDRPRAWLVFETAEAMEAEPVARRVAELSGGGSADLVEDFPWDRWNIHAPAIQALIAVAKSRSEGAEIWPLTPWPSASGLFTRALGVGLAEWAVPLPAGTTFRIPTPDQFQAVALEVAELLMRTARGDGQKSAAPPTS
jgi:hypothetical protein